jgi:hypothetical protein
MILPKQYYQLFKSYLYERKFRIKYEELKEIRAGVPQGSVLGPALYLLYINDLPGTLNCTIATFTDDTAIMATGNTLDESTTKMQRAADDVTWTRNWRIKLNETKFTYINFTHQKIDQRSIFLNGVRIPPENTAKYHGMTLGAKPHWKAHIKKKQGELQIKFRKMHWQLGRRSELSMYNKLLLYKQTLRPVWTYGVQLWECAKKRNLDIIQLYQNKVLRYLVNAPWYALNSDIHRDLGVETVTSIKQTKQTPWPLVRERTIPTERPPLVDEI